MEYLIDDKVNTTEKLFPLYVAFEKDDDKRKMGSCSFYLNMKLCYPELRLTRIEEDACDICVELKTGKCFLSQN